MNTENKFKLFTRTLAVLLFTLMIGTSAPAQKAGTSMLAYPENPIVITLVQDEQFMTQLVYAGAGQFMIRGTYTYCDSTTTRVNALAIGDAADSTVYQYTVDRDTILVSPDQTCKKSVFVFKIDGQRFYESCKKANETILLFVTIDKRPIAVHIEPGVKAKLCEALNWKESEA